MGVRSLSDGQFPGVAAAAGPAATPEHPQYHQLTMFHTARELREGGVGKFLPSDKETVNEYDPKNASLLSTRKETTDEAWDRKMWEAEDSGLSQHIFEHGGVERPVDLSVGDKIIGRETGTVMNGHHRIAAAHDINPDSLVPVEWTARMHAGSRGRVHYPGHEPEEKANWSSEDEEDIGYNPYG